MARWKRKELEKAFDSYQEAALKGAQTGDWTDWANCFTEDATYFEHHYGRFWGRETILNWITATMNKWPASEMKAFPITWYSILHYAGNGLFKYEEDAYNPHNMGVTIGAWIEARKKLDAGNDK